MFPPPDTSAWATPSLQWVPWPPLAGALRFPTFLGTIGFYDCSRSVRNPSGRPLVSRTSPTEEEIGSSLRFLGHPCGACPGLGTPASRPDLANNGRCQMLPSARLTTSASPRQTISGLILTACFLAVYASHPPVARRVGRGRDSGCPLPPAQSRAGAVSAHGSYLGCLASKRTLGQGCSIPA